MPEYDSFFANDGTRLVYQSHGQRGKRALLLLHGFTGSSQYFTRNFEALSKQYWIVAPDLRGHGNSGKTRWGFSVARLAADLRDLLLHLNNLQRRVEIIGVGCSIGAAILWTYAELFDSEDFIGMIFVDQAPLQDYRLDEDWDERFGNYGCHDADTLAAAQRKLVNTPVKFYQGLVRDCLAYRSDLAYKSELSQDDQPLDERAKADEDFFVGISKQGDPTWFAKLLANHTSYDHRNTLTYNMNVRCGVLAGKYSGCFPLAGMTAATDLLNARHTASTTQVIVNSGHCESHVMNGLGSPLRADIFRDVL